MVDDTPDLDLEHGLLTPLVVSLNSQVMDETDVSSVDPATATCEQMVQLSDGSFHVICAHCKVSFTYPKPSRPGVKLQSAQRCLAGFKKDHSTCQPITNQGNGPSPASMEPHAPDVNPSNHDGGVDPATATCEQMVQLSDGSFNVVCAHCKVSFTYPKPSRPGVTMQSAQRCLAGFKKHHSTCQPVEGTFDEDDFNGANNEGSFDDDAIDHHVSHHEVSVEPEEVCDCSVTALRDCSVTAL